MKKKDILKHYKKKTVQDYLEDFEDAKQKRDPDKMKEALYSAMEVCYHKNSMCLDEIFCPDCPFGGLEFPRNKRTPAHCDY